MKPAARNTDAQSAGVKAIPLPLTPMVLPYMRQARVSFRIERVPQAARLSRGRKNDDHSWSLSDTEIRDVAYIPPRDGTIPPMLAIRVVRVDSGDTLGIIEVPIVTEETKRQERAAARAQARAANPEAVVTPPPRRAAAPSPASDDVSALAKELVQEEMAKIRAELAVLQSSLASRDAELEQARAEIEKSKSGEHVGAALNDVEKWWRAAEAARMATAQAEWQEQTARAVAEARAQADAKVREEVAKAVTAAQEQAAAKAREEAAKAIAEAQEQAKAQARQEIAKAVADAQAQAAVHARGEIAKAVAEAQEQAKAKQRDEIARAVADAQEKAAAQAREEIAKVLAEAQAGSAPGDPNSPLVLRLQTELKGMQEKLAARDKQIAQERTRWQQEFVAQLEQAQNSWKAGEASRLAAAEARANEKDAELVKLRRDLVAMQAAATEQSNELAYLKSTIDQERSKWREEAATAVSRSEAQWKIAEASRLAAAEGRATDKDAEVRRINAELSTAQASLAKVTSELAEAQSAMIKGREEMKREHEAALASAERIWKAGEAARIASLEAQWKEQSAKAIAEARAAAQASDSEAPRLRAELSAAEALVSKQKSEMAELQRSHLEQRAKWQQEMAAAVAEAEKTWKMDEIARMTSAKEQWQQQMAKAVADARSQATASTEGANALELRRLRAEYAALKATLAAREEELRRAQLAAPTAPTTSASPAAEPPPEKIVLSPDRRKGQRRDLRADAQKDEEAPKNRILRDAAIAAMLALGAIVFFFPKIEAVFLAPPNAAAPVQAAGPDASGGTAGNSASGAAQSGSGQARNAGAQTKAAPPPKPSGPKTMTVVHAANVHTDPSGVADVIANMQIGDKVTPLEQRGNWTRIQVTGPDANAPPMDGWIYTPYLQDSAN